MRADSDHFAFFERQLPALMFHTGLHDDYHRPSDDAEKVNREGLVQVSRLIFDVTVELADRPDAIAFRSASQSESESARRRLEEPLAPLPSRLGVRLAAAGEAAAGVVVTAVTPGSAADVGGLKRGDQIEAVAGQPPRTPDEVVKLTLQADAALPLVVRSAGQEPRELSVQLGGQRVRVGLSWRADDAEPQSVLVCRVVPSSAADAAGLAVGDRICRFAGEDIQGSDDLEKRLGQSTGKVELLVETGGRMRAVTLDVPR
jgi:C-terminal processing protease CtpA/Prc